MKKRAKYICIEGSEGTGKGTQVDLITKYLRDQGYKVLQTKEPGTDRFPLSIKFREFALDKSYGEAFDGITREYLMQVSRALHLNNDLYKNMYDFDFIIQDRGIMSGLAYASALDLDKKFLKKLNNTTVSDHGKNHGINGYQDLYDLVLFFSIEDVSKYLENAKNAKQEFESGDAMEALGGEFMEKVKKEFKELFSEFPVNQVLVEDNGEMRSRDDILKECIEKILKA